MKINNIEFTREEIEEIELAKDLCDGMQVGGEKVVCFEILSQLFNMDATASVEREDLLKAYAQLVQYNKFWSQAKWFNNRQIEIVTTKIKEMLR